MAAMQSYCRRLLGFNTTGFIKKNGILFQPNQRKYHLFLHAYSSQNKLILRKSALLSCTGRLLSYRLESTSVIQPKNTDSDVSKLQTFEHKNEPSQLSNEGNISESPNVIIDETTLPPIPTSYLTEVPDVEFIYTELKEPSFESLGLGSWWPPGLIQQMFEYFHINWGLPWWEVIIIGTVIFRILLFPVYVKNRKDSIILMNHFPEINKFQEKINKAKLAGDYNMVAITSHELLAFMKERKLSYFSATQSALFQAPVFLSMFYGLRKMSNLPVESLKTGGLFWFTDLTQPDPYYILPAILSCTLLAVIELGAEGTPVGKKSVFIKWLLRGIPVLVFFFSMTFPSCIALYWTTSNFIVLLQVGLLKIPFISKALKMPKAIPAASVSEVRRKGFIQEIKEGFNNAKLTSQIQERERLNVIAFQKAGSTPVPRTFKNNPVFQKEK